MLSRTAPLRGLHLDHGNAFNATIGSGVGPTVWCKPLMHRWLRDMKEKATFDAGNGESRSTSLFARSRRPGTVRAMGDFFEREGRR